jgi:hypothetical protein
MRAVALIASLVTTLAATSVFAQTAPPAVYVQPVQPVAAAPQGGAPGVRALPLQVYEQESKSRFGALVLEYFVPGVGCIYAGNLSAAFKTWTLTFGGAATLVYGIKRSYDGYDDDATMGMIIGGVVITVVGRILGLHDAWVSADEHNAALRAVLGVPAP